MTATACRGRLSRAASKSADSETHVRQSRSARRRASRARRAHRRRAAQRRGARARRARPTTTSARPPRRPGCRRRRCTASRPSTTTCSRRAARRHVRVCTGTACFAATGGAHEDGDRRGPGRRARRARRRRLGLARRDRLPGLLPQRARGPRRRRRRRRRRASSTACWPARRGQAPEPPARSLLAEPVLTAPGDWSGPAPRARASPRPSELLAAQVDAADLRGRGGAWFPAGPQVGVRPRPPRRGQRYVVANGDEGDPGSYIDKHLMERTPGARARGHGAHRATRSARREGFVLVRSEYPRSRPALEAAIAAARADGPARRRTSSAAASRSTCTSSTAPAPTSSARRPRCSPACTACAAPSPPARRSPPSAGSTAARPSSTTSRRSRTSRVIAARGAARLPRPQPGEPERRARSSSASTSASRAPASSRCPFGMPVRELCEERRRRARRRARRSRRVQIGGPLGGHPAGVAARHAVRHRRRWPSTAAWSATASILAFDDTTDMRALATHLLRVRRARELRHVLPVPDRPAARARGVRRAARPVDRERLEALLETLEVASLCAHGGGMPAPIRSLLDALPGRAGAALMRVTIDGSAGRGPGRGDGARRRARRRARRSRRSASTSGMAPFGACRVCLVGVAGAGGRTDVVASCTTPCREGMVVETRDPRARRVVGAVVELVLSELPAPPAAAHRARRRRRATSASASRAGAARCTSATATTRHPVPGLPARAVHLLRALRARLRRDPGRVRADGDRPRASTRTSPPGSTQGFRESACVSCGACADTCPTDAITELSLLAIADASEDDGERAP